MTDVLRLHAQPPTKAIFEDLIATYANVCTQRAICL